MAHGVLPAIRGCLETQSQSKNGFSREKKQSILYIMKLVKKKPKPKQKESYSYAQVDLLCALQLKYGFLHLIATLLLLYAYF